jgi:transposase-like protein
MQSRLGRPLRGYVEERYQTDGLTLAELAADLGIGVTTLRKWMRLLGIEPRFPGQRGRAS